MIRDISWIVLLAEEETIHESHEIHEGLCGSFVDRRKDDPRITRNTRKPSGHAERFSSTTRKFPGSLRSGSACTFRHRTERAESQIKQGRGDTETQFRSLIVVQQVILSEVLQKPESARSMMALKVEPLIIEVTTRHADEQVGSSRPGTSYSPRK